MDNVAEEDFKKQMNVLLKQPGVVDHGRQGVDIIIKEKQTASFIYIILKQLRKQIVYQ